MAFALTQSQSGTTTSSSSIYMSTAMSSTSSATAYWPDADASPSAGSATFNSHSSGVPGGGSSHVMPYNAQHSSAASASIGSNAGSLYSVHHQSINPDAHNSYAGYSANGQEHTANHHSASATVAYPHSHSSQHQRTGSGVAGGMRHSPAIASPSSMGSSSLQHALRPHGHPHAHHPSLSAALASSTGSGSGGVHAHVPSPSPFSSSSSGSSGSNSLVSSLAVSSLSSSGNANSNSSVSPISPHPRPQYSQAHGQPSQSQQFHQSGQTQQTLPRNSTSYVHSHAYPPQGSSANSGTGTYIPSGPSGYQHHAPTSGPNPISSNTNIHSNNNSAVGSATANLDDHSGLYAFDDSPEPFSRGFESDFGASGSPNTSHRGTSSQNHTYPRLQIPTNAQAYGHGQVYTPVSPHSHAQSRSSSGHAHAVNGYGYYTPSSGPGETLATYTRERSDTRTSTGSGGGERTQSGNPRVKTEPDLEESRSFERSPGLSRRTDATPSHTGGGVPGGGNAGGDGTGGARFVMEHPYPYSYATRTSQRTREGVSVSPPPSPSVSMTSANGVSYSSSPSTTVMSPERHQKNEHPHQELQMQTSPHTLTAPLRAVNASAEMRRCMGVFRLDPFAQLNGVALRCGFVSSSFDEAAGKKTKNKKNKSKGKKGGKKRGRGRKTRKNAQVMADSDDDDAMLSDLTEFEQDDEGGESSDDNTPTWDGLPAGPLAEEPALIEFQLYFDGMEVEGEDDGFGVADGEDVGDMKVIDAAKWEAEQRVVDVDVNDVDYNDDYDYASRGPRNLKYGRSRAYSYSAAALTAGDREKGAASTASSDSRRYRANSDVHKVRYGDNAEYAENNNNARCGPEYERETQDRKSNVGVASFRSYYQPVHSQAQERVSMSSAPRTTAASTSRTLGVFEEYLDLDLGTMESMDDISMDASMNAATTTATNEMDEWETGGTSPTTPYETGERVRGNPFDAIVSARAQSSSMPASVRPATLTGATIIASTTCNANNANSSSAEPGASPIADSNPFPATSVHASFSSPMVPSSQYANEYTTNGQARARYIDSAGYMRLSESTQLPHSSTLSSSDFLSGQSTPSTAASTSGNANSVPSSSPSPFYGLASGAGVSASSPSSSATGANSTDIINNATLQQLRTQAALRAVSAHAAQAHQPQHGLYRTSSETVPGNMHTHRLSGAVSGYGSGVGVGSSGGGCGSAGAASGPLGHGHGHGAAPAVFRPTPASLAAEMQTGLLVSGRLGSSSASVPVAKSSLVGEGQGQHAYNTNAYPQLHASYGRDTPPAGTPSSSTATGSSGDVASYSEYASGFSGSPSGSGSFGQNHGHGPSHSHTNTNAHAHAHCHGHGDVHTGNRKVQSDQSALERRWSDVLQRVHG